MLAAQGIQIGRVMDQMARSDAFFLITAIAVVLAGTGLCVALVYCTLILHDVKRISSRIRTETDLIADDVGGLRQDLGHIVRFVRGVLGLKELHQRKGG